MNYKPQTLSVLLLATGIAASGAGFTPFSRQLAAQAADEQVAPANNAATPDATAAPAPGDVLDSVRQKLEDVDSLKCNIQETAILSGMKFFATGTYVQVSGNRVRLEFQIFPAATAKAGDGTPKLDAEPNARDPKEIQGSLLQVSNGSVLYSQWQNGPTTRVTRRSITDIVKAAGETDGYDATRAIQDLGVGGLKGLISRLQTTMEFAPTKKESLGGTEFWVLTGRWTPKVRKEIFRLADDVQVIPEDFVPEYARLYIDANSMLPRRLQFLKRSPNPSEKLVRPIVTLDLRQIVLNETVDDAVFEYQAPDDVQEEDITEQTIKTLQELAKPAATPAAESASPETTVPTENKGSANP